MWVLILTLLWPGYPSSTIEITGYATEQQCWDDSIPRINIYMRGRPPYPIMEATCEQSSNVVAQDNSHDN